MRYTSCEAIEILSKDRITGKHKRKERGATVPRPSLSSCDFVEELTKKVFFSRYCPPPPETRPPITAFSEKNVHYYFIYKHGPRLSDRT